MPWKRADSLRWQLLRWLLPPLLLFLLGTAWFSHRTADATANRTFDRLLMASANAIAEDIEYRSGELMVDLPYAALELLESNLSERIFYRVIGPGAETVTGYDDLPAPPATPAGAAPPESEHVFYRATYRGETLYLIALKKRIYDAESPGPVWVIVAVTGEARDALSQQIFFEELVRQSLLIAAACLLAWLGLLQGLKPLERLRSSIMRRPVSNLAPIDARSAPAEVRPLIEALNQHTARVDQMLARRKLLVADATHQMRTPLAEMGMHIDVTLREADPALHRQALVELRTDIDRLSRLVSQFLLQTRSDIDGVAKHAHTPVDLAALAQQAVLATRSVKARSVNLRMEPIAQAAVVPGNALLLGEMIVNLIDNAVAYTQAGGHVAVRLAVADAVVLEVQDDGPGIPPEEREHVFERFYRSPSAIASNPSGSGLGLAIVRDIAAGHGATVTLNTPPDGRGLCVRVVFSTRTATD
ncbi:MAG: sensor histidine kinase N-terminal domain-containing protein [Proteobacteria bacterium]|nr:sensor histidine kinase N-terminal domain-containing protein [Pseudomonadota bacterium]